MIKDGTRGWIIALSFVFLATLFLMFRGAKAEVPQVKNGSTEFSTFNAAQFQSSDSPWPFSINTVEKLKLAKTHSGYESQRTYISEPINISSDQITKFNAVAGNWKLSVPTGTSLKIRINIFNGSWSGWQTLTLGEDLTGRDDAVGGLSALASGEVYSNLIFAQDATQFQYEAILATKDASFTPALDEITFNYLDSSEGPTVSSADSDGVSDFAGGPKVISRTAWGCPEGETSPDWAPQTATKTFQAYHHTVTTNGYEPYSVMRAIWYYHAKTRGWGDIGYNWVVDQSGHIYKGRNGPKNVIGAHVYGYNTHSIGAAVLGTYINSAPSSAALSGLAQILGYSAYTNGSGIKLYGHRELTPTQCPGDAFYAKKASISAAARFKLLQYTIHVLKYNGQNYYEEGGKIWRVPTSDIFNSWRLSKYPIREIDATEFLTYQNQGDFGYFGSSGTRAYIAVGLLKAVDSGYLATRWGKVLSDLPLIPKLITVTPKSSQLVRFIVKSPEGTSKWYLTSDKVRKRITDSVLAERDYYEGNSDLVPIVPQALIESYHNLGYISYRDGTYPFQVIRYQDVLYYHENTTTRKIPNGDILWHLGFTASDIRDISQEEFDTYFHARDMDYFVKNASHVYIASAGKLKLVMDDYLAASWQMSYAEAERNDGLIRRMPKSGAVSFLARASSVSPIYYLSGGGKKQVFSSVFKNWGYYHGDTDLVPGVPQALLDKYTNNGYWFYKDGTLIQKEGATTVYYMENQQKRYISKEVFASWKFSPVRILIINVSMFNLIPTGANFPPKRVTTLLGPYGLPVSLPAYSGKTAREQHLWFVANESASHHYAISNTPLDCRNGMAGGYGAFGSAATTRQERYYVNMRWLYATWYEDSNGNTLTKDVDTILKAWHRHKKVIVTNPSTGKSVVASIEEAGPAIWTDRVSGLSPEAMKVIGAVTNSNLYYYWAGDQSMPLGLTP